MKKIIVSILIIFLCTVSIGHSKLYLMEESFYNRYGVSAEGLVLWLDQFDGRSYGNAGIWYDISGNGNHAVQGTGANQPAITGALGLAGSCRSFDGDNDNLVTGFNPFNEINTSDFTISVWLRHTGGVDRRYIIGPTTPAPRFYCRLNVPGELNRIVWGLGNDFKTFSTVLQANQFYCVTFVFDYRFNIKLNSLFPRPISRRSQAALSGRRRKAWRSMMETKFLSENRGVTINV